MEERNLATNAIADADLKPSIYMVNKIKTIIKWKNTEEQVLKSVQHQHQHHGKCSDRQDS